MYMVRKIIRHSEHGIEMYVIVVYDVGEERVARINKFFKSYLLWIQNSVFEGTLSESLFQKMIGRLARIITDDDSFIIYKIKTESYVDRMIIGKEKGVKSNII